MLAPDGVKRIIVGSQNPVKVQAALAGFRRMFPDQSFQAVGVSAPSQVGSQPRGDDETLLGARNRAANSRQLYPDADYWIGIEGGIQEFQDEVLAFAWVVVLSERGMGKARSGAFFLPAAVARWIQAGKELGEADDLVFGRFNSKQENGAVGILTGNVIERRNLYEEAVVLSLIPFKNPELYGT